MSSRDQISNAAVPVGPTAPVGVCVESLRAYPRVPFRGAPFQLQAGRMSCSVRMRDLSCGGASAICEEPLEIGSFVTICLARDEWIEAEVRWIERMNVGLKFTHPLPPGLVRRLHQTHGTFVTTRRKR
jgi:hypothetical protein